MSKKLPIQGRAIKVALVGCGRVGQYHFKAITQFNQTQYLRWIMDATLILKNTSKTVDWERFLSHATQCQIKLTLESSLKYLQQYFQVDVPRSVFLRLSALPTTRFERREYRYRTSNHAYALLMIHWYRHTRIMNYDHCLKRLLTFPRYCHYRLGVERPWQLFVHIARKLVFLYQRNRLFRPKISS